MKNPINVSLVFLMKTSIEGVLFDKNGNEHDVMTKEFAPTMGLKGKAVKDGDAWHLETPDATYLVPANVVRATRC